MATIGRPTKYNQSILDIANAYIEDYQSEHGHTIPSIAGLSLIVDVRRETLHVWAKEKGKEKFSNILAKLLAKQEQLLLSNGLSGDFNAGICKLVLGKHNYHDSSKQEVVQTIKYDDMTDDDLDLRLQRLEALCDQSGRD